MISRGLTLAHHKSEAIMLTRKWAYRTPILISGTHQIEAKRAVKYLGVTLDSHLSFTAHVKTVASAAVKSTKAIGRLLPNVGGPSQAKRALLASVMSAKLLYAAPVWAKKASGFITYVATMNRALRIAVIRVSRCYQTVSAAAALFLAGIPPDDLLALEKEEIARRRSLEPLSRSSALAEDVRRVTVESGR